MTVTKNIIIFHTSLFFHFFFQGFSLSKNKHEFLREFIWPKKTKDTFLELNYKNTCFYEMRNCNFVLHTLRRKGNLNLNWIWMGVQRALLKELNYIISFMISVSQ